MARDLLIRHGFNGFSYAHLSRPLNIRNAAVHYHFASKVELGLHLLESCRRPIAPRLGAADKPRKAVLRYLEAACEPEGDFCDLQVIGAMAADYEGLPDLLKAASRTALTHHTKWLSGRLKASRKGGQFHFNGKAKPLASKILMSIQGAHLFARITGNQCLQELAHSWKGELTS